MISTNSANYNYTCNLVTFVAFKNYTMQAEMIAALTDENSRIRSFSKFKKEVTSHNEKYNKHWLRTEYNTAKTASRTAAQWEDYMRNAHIFPYLVYKSQDDSKVRNNHKSLHNVAKHIHDSFWVTNHPPNGWNCRCYILQAKNTDGFLTEPESYPSDDDQPIAFQFNAGKEKKIWNDKHPYFMNLPKKIKDRVWKERNRFYSS